MGTMPRRLPQKSSALKKLIRGPCWAPVVIIALTYILHDRGPVDDRTRALRVGDWFLGPTSRDCSAVHFSVIAVVVGGMISAFGMFNALVMSYSRLPLAMAQDVMLPQVLHQAAS